MKARHGKVALLVVALTMGALRTWVLSAQGLAPRSKAPQLEWIQEIFVDYGSPSHAGPGPHPTTESSDFHVTMGGIRWFAGDTVKYEITGTAPSELNNAIEAAEATWDTFITTREFVRDDTSPTELRRASAVKQRHEQTLMALPGVTGARVGAGVSAGSVLVR